MAHKEMQAHTLSGAIGFDPGGRMYFSSIAHVARKPLRKKKVSTELNAKPVELCILP